MEKTEDTVLLPSITESAQIIEDESLVQKLTKTVESKAQPTLSVEPSSALKDAKHEEVEAKKGKEPSVLALKKTKLRKTDAEVETIIKKEPVMEEDLQEQSILESKRDSIPTAKKEEFPSTFNSKTKLKRTDNNVESLEKITTKNKPESTPAFAKMKLKKTEQVKRKIESAAMETVQLVHHEFENIPQEPKAEQVTSVLIASDPFPEIEKHLESIESDREKEKRKQLKTKNLLRKVEMKDDIQEETKPKKQQEKPSIKMSEEDQPVTKKVDTNIDLGLKPKSKKKILVPEVVEFSAIKLKKSETIKRSFSPPQLETVQLVHHEFENIPQDPSLERDSQVLLKTEPLGRLEVESTSSKKNLSAKKVKKPVSQSPDEEEEILETTGEDANNDLPVVSPEQNENSSSKDKIKQNEKLPTLARVNVDSEKPNKTRKLPLEHEKADLSSIKLKKSETIKRPISPSQVETVKLAHHDFENIPQNPPLEGDSRAVIKTEPIKVGKPDSENIPGIKKPVVKKAKKPSSHSLNSEKDKEKESTEPAITPTVSKPSQEKKKQVEKPLQVLTAQQQGNEMEPEEVTRQPKVPIVKPAAAVEKKHSDTERVNLPTFLNFPSEQGVTVIPQESIVEPSNHPNYEEICETIEEENPQSPKIIETKPTVKALGKKKVFTKDQETGPPVVSIPISKTTVTSETVTFMEVFTFLRL